MSVKTLRIALLGDRKVGKSAYAERLRSGQFLDKYSPTAEGKGIALRYYTSVGEFRVELYECVGTKLPANIDAALIMFDCTSCQSYLNSSNYYVATSTKPFPKVLVCNKVDSAARVVFARDIRLHNVWGIPVFQISAKSMYDYVAPILEVIRATNRNHMIKFAEAPPVADAKVAKEDKHWCECGADARKFCEDCAEWLCDNHVRPHAEVGKCEICHQDACKVWIKDQCACCIWCINASAVRPEHLPVWMRR